MTNRVVTILLVLIVTVALVGEATRNVMEPQGQWQEWLQLLVAQQLADTLDRQVQLGPISDISLDGVTASSLAVAEGFYLANGAFARADTVKISFDLTAILRRQVAPAAGISRVRIEDAWVHLVRDPAGVFNVQDLLPEPEEPPPPPEERFQGIVTVADSIVIYDDYSVDIATGAPLNVELAGVNAEIDMREVGWATVELGGYERLGRFGALTVSGQTETETGFAWARVNIGNIDGAYWFNTMVSTPDLSVQGGTVDVAATVGLMPQETGEPEPSVAADAVISNGRATLAALDGREVIADMTLTGTLDGAEIHSLDARMGGTSVEATGFIGDWDDPVVDLDFDARMTRPTELFNLAPELDPQTQAQVEAVAIEGPVLASGTIVGPVENANLSAQIEASGQVRYANVDVGEIVAGPLDLRVDLLDIADPNVRGRADIARADPVDLEPLRASLPEDLDGTIEVEPIENITTNVLWSAEIPIVQTQIALPRVSVGELSVANLSADVSMAGDVFYLRDLRAEPLGATLTADAVIDLGGEEGLWGWADGQIAGLNLERLSELAALDAAAGVSGEFSGEFVAEYSDQTPFAMARGVIDRPGYEDYGAESLRAMVVVDENSVQVRGAGVQDALGVAWVRGVLPFEGEMAASFAVAGVNLETANERFDLDLEGIEGEFFLTGSATGTPDHPRVDTTLRAFNLHYQGYEVDAVGADVEGDLERLQITDLFASSGRIVAKIDGSLTNIDLEEKNAEIDGTIRLAGPVDRTALELVDMQDRDLVGALNADVEVSGTLRQPSADGAVYLDYARYDAVVTDDAVMRVSLQGDTLQMDELRVPIGDAVVYGSASMTSVFDEPIVSAGLRARDVVLQDMALWQEMGLPMSGTVNLPYLSLTGPLNDLKGLAQIEAADLEVGDEEIGAISAAVVLDENTLMLRRTNIALAGGELAVEGSYRLDQQRIMPSEIVLDDVSISELLQAAVPIARWLEEGEPGGEAEGPSLERRLASMSLRLGGRLDGSVSVEGPIPEPAPEGASTEETIENLLASLTAEVDVSAREPSFDNKPLPDTRLHAEVADGPEVALDLEAAEGDALITAVGTWRPDGAIDLLTEVSAFELAQFRPWVPGAVEAVGGRLNLTIQATGTLENPILIGSVDIIEPEAHGVKFDLVSAPIIRYDGEAIDLDSLVVREAEEEFYVDGRIPFDWDSMSVPGDGDLRVVMRADGTDLAIFPPVISDAVGETEGGPLSQMEATGSLDSLVRITGTPRRPELNGEIAVNAPSISTPWLGSPFEDTVLTAAFTGIEGTTVVEIEEFTSRVESTTVEAGGTADMTHYELATLGQNEYDLWVSVNAAKQRIGNDGLALRSVRGQIALQTQETGEQLLSVDELGANLGDGSVLLDGTVGLITFVPAKLAENDFDLRIVADDARPRYGNLFMGTVDGTIDVANPGPQEPVSVAGVMTLTHAIIGVPPLVGGEGEGLTGMPASFPSANLEVNVAIGQDVRVRTTGLTAPLEPTDSAVVLRGTPQRPVLSGRVEVQEGEAEISGGVLNIETAGVQYLVRPKLGPRRAPPVELVITGPLWATATRTIDETVIDGRRIEDVLIEMNVSGTLPNHIHVEVSSVPPLADEQIYALLGTTPFTGGGSLAEAGDLEDVMTEQFVSALGAAFRHYVFQPFQEDLREILGLSVFEVSFAFDQPVDVRLGGYLIEDLLVTYETSVYGATDSEYELNVSYRVQRQFELTYETNEENDNRFLVEYVYEF